MLPDFSYSPVSTRTILPSNICFKIFFIDVLNYFVSVLRMSGLVIPLSRKVNFIGLCPIKLITFMCYPSMT